MIPRTVLMAKAVENSFTAAQLAQFGNIIGPLYRGWSTNYYGYFTQLQPNGYGINPGDPTLFEYTVRSFTPFTGPIVSLGGIVDGTGYTPGTYTGVATTTSGSGTGATLDITVAPDGTIQTWALNAVGANYSVGNSVIPTGIGPGVGFQPLVTAIVPTSGGAPVWGQRPQRVLLGGGVIPIYGIRPVQNNPVPPPIADLEEATPPPPTPTYAISTLPATATDNDTITSSVTTTNVADGTTLYWSYTGTGLTGSFFTDGLTQGSVTVTSNAASFSSTFVASVPSSLTMTVSLFSDAGRTTLVASDTVSVTSTAPVPHDGVFTATPAAASVNTVITGTVTDAAQPDGTVIYWSYSGTGITSAFFLGGSLTGTATFSGGVATWSDTTAATFPTSDTYTLNIQLFSDAGRTTQIYQTQPVVIFDAVPSTPTLGAYIDLFQYRNMGGVYPAGSYVGWNPNATAEDLAPYLPTLTDFYFFTEIQLYQDGKLYMGPNGGVPDALVLNSTETDWADNTGSVSGGYVDPSNPDYANSAYAVKNSLYYLNNPTPQTDNIILSIGGYLLSETMDLAGADLATAQIAASQIANFVQITGAKGVDLDYEPVGVVCKPANMALLCQEVRAALDAIDPALKLFLTVIPSLDQADSNLRMATAAACQAYVDQVNVMTYDDLSAYGQPDANGQPFYNQTGVERTVQTMQWFIDTGVDPGKLGMGMAMYGRPGDPPPTYQWTASYAEIVKSADLAGQTTNSFPLGRYEGTVLAQNPAPTGPSDYYDPPVTANWGFDSVGTIQEKVQAASNMGLKGVFFWQLSNDYANPGSPLPAGNARADFALLQGAQFAIANL